MYGLLYWTIFENLSVQKNLNIEKIIFKVVQMKFLAMHINNQKLSFDIFMVGNVQNNLNILMIFGIKEKYCWLLLQIYLLLMCSGITYSLQSKLNLNHKSNVDFRWLS